MFQIKKILLLSLFLQSICLSVIAQANIKMPFIDPLSNSSRINKIQDGSAIASISLYNPTQSDESSIVEIPVGNLATPSLIDWQNAKLVYNGELLPFALREGRAHWKATLRAPIKKPRSEDLLVFTIRVHPGQWAQVELVAGYSKPSMALTQEGRNMIISYPNMKVVIDKRTGLLIRLEAFGDSLLSTPMSLQFFKVGEGVANYEKKMGPSAGYQICSSGVLKKLGDLEPPKVKMVSWSSMEALTEINFILEPMTMNGPSIGLTYRIYPNNQIEILSDERPWQGHSPWLENGLQYKLSLAGNKDELPDFQTHFPMYGFKDYASCISSVGTLYHGTKTRVYELGEENLNGRFWHRRVAIYPESERAQQSDPLTLLEKGLIVTVSPMMSQPLSKKLLVAYPREIKAIGDLLVDSLKKLGVEVLTVSIPDNNFGCTILLNLVNDPSDMGISGDGFRIQPLHGKKGIEVVAGTKFGLFRGISCFEKLNLRRDSMTVPLVAQNPVVDLRAGGFGGGNFEVDFPYGNDTEWEHAFSGMITSGMNVMTDLGMWSNWAMPVSYKYMPELQSDSSNDYDEVSGTKFSEIANQREHGLKLLNFLNARGVKVWLWIPIGAIPTTFEKKFPEATLSANSINSNNSKTPRFMSPEYRQYLEAYFKELLEVYPVDGFVLIRDDNGGVDTTNEFKKYVTESKTKNPVWEQYLVMYKLLRSLNFKGQIAVYPYEDLYGPQLDTLLPQDLLIVGHGSGMGVLTRDFNTLGAMGDTWLDNLYDNFRLPSSGRMKRLLADHGSYWIGGAYCGTELPWEAVGYFGWQPTASINSFRYEFGVRTFGKENGVPFVAFSNAYERLWEIMDDWLLPQQWITLSESERMKTVQESTHWLETYHEKLNRLKEGSNQKAHETWFSYVGLYGTFFDYYLSWAELFSKMEAITVDNRQTVDSGNSLSESLRQRLITMNDEIYSLARRYDEQAAKVPGNMIAQTRVSKLTLPFNNWTSGYNQSLENVIQIKQFDGQLNISTIPQLTAGQPFELKVELQNRGCMPWITGAGHEIRLKGETKLLGLPDRWIYEGVPMVYGDRRVIILRGVVPVQPGETQIKFDFMAPFRGGESFLSQTINLKW
jgi:hypothetical protein